jgi:excisionase family DNA binding protein
MAIIAHPFLTVNELAELVRVSPDWIRKEIKWGRLGCFYVGGRPRIAPEQIFDWLVLVEKTPKYGARSLSVLGRDGIWERTFDGWRWKPYAPEGKG